MGVGQRERVSTRRLTPSFLLVSNKLPNRCVDLHGKHPRPPSRIEIRKSSAQKVAGFYTAATRSRHAPLIGRLLLRRVHPASCRGDDSSHFRSLISRVGEDFRDERKTPPRALQQTTSAVAILDIGRQNAHAEEETERVDKDVALAARDLLARVEPLRINCCAPF